MGENIASPDGHIVLVVTPAGGAQPTYRAHLVVEQNPAKARSIVARHVRAKEIAYGDIKDKCFPC